MKKPFNIKNYCDSVKDDYIQGKITLHEAAIELCKGGYTTCVSEEKTKKYLGL